MKKREITTTDLFEAFSAFSEQCATKDDLKCFATKDDLKSFATKDDLKSFATKDDLKAIRSEMAMKDDLKSFATKDELKAVKNDLNVVKDDLKSVKEDVKSIKEDTQKLLRFFPSLIHKEDRKVNTLVERLVAKRVFTRSEVEDILDAHPLVS